MKKHILQELRSGTYQIFFYLDDSYEMTFPQVSILLTILI